jgi:Ran GTPase-activating protein (RanGAP) involved in mRNA processing and transport
MENIEEILEKHRAEIEQECSKRKIDLTATGLEDLDALTIALFLIKSDNSIESLYLGSNSISDDGMEALAKSLSKHPELRHLYLGGNLFREGGVEALSQVLPDLISLETLSLGGAHIDDTQMNNLASALLSMENTSLKHLYLNANCISDEGLLSLS